MRGFIIILIMLFICGCSSVAIKANKENISELQNVVEAHTEFMIETKKDTIVNRMIIEELIKQIKKLKEFNGL